MLITSGAGAGRRCPVCGEAHAVCGPVGTGTPIDIPERSAGMARAGRTAKEPRWIKYNGSWRLFKINKDDPRYAQSAPYDAEVEGSGRPDARLSGTDIQQGRTMADIEQQLADDKAAAEQRAGGPVSDKARRPGGRRAGAATRRGSSTSPDSDEN